MRSKEYSELTKKLEKDYSGYLVLTIGCLISVITLFALTFYNMDRLDKLESSASLEMNCKTENYYNYTMCVDFDKKQLSDRKRTSRVYGLNEFNETYCKDIYYQVEVCT